MTVSRFILLTSCSSISSTMEREKTIFSMMVRKITRGSSKRCILKQTKELMLMLKQLKQLKQLVVQMYITTGYSGIYIEPYKVT